MRSSDEFTKNRALNLSVVSLCNATEISAYAKSAIHNRIFKDGRKEAREREGSFEKTRPLKRKKYFPFSHEGDDLFYGFLRRSDRAANQYIYLIMRYVSQSNLAAMSITNFVHTSSPTLYIHFVIDCH